MVHPNKLPLMLGLNRRLLPNEGTKEGKKFMINLLTNRTITTITPNSNAASHNNNMYLHTLNHTLNHTLTKPIHNSIHLKIIHHSTTNRCNHNPTHNNSYRSSSFMSNSSHNNTLNSMHCSHTNNLTHNQR